MKFNKFNVLALALALVMSVFAATVFAASTFDKVKAKGVINVGNSPDYPPFESLGDNGERVGFDIDLMNALAKKIGVKINWVTMDFAAIVTAAQSGQVDIGISGLSYTEERAKSVLFSDAYFASGQALVVRSDSSIKSTTDLAGKKVAAQLGSTGAEAADKIENVEVVKPDTYNVAFMMLNNKAVEAVVADLSVADEFVKRGTFKRAGEPLSYEEFGIVTRKGNDTLISALNKALAELKADGTYDAIVKKWNL